MSNPFPGVTKYLDFGPTRVATLDEATNHQTPFDKYYKYADTRAVKKIPTNLIVPKHHYDQDELIAYQKQILLFQYNFSLERDFHILDELSDLPLLVSGGELCIKWRIGTTVFRYKLNKFVLGVDTLMYAPLYADTRPKIKKNFCIEFWFIGYPNIDITGAGYFSDLILRTSILNNPDTSDDIKKDITINTPILERGPLSQYVPYFIPANQDNLAWLDN